MIGERVTLTVCPLVDLCGPSVRPYLSPCQCLITVRRADPVRILNSRHSRVPVLITVTWVTSQRVRERETWQFSTTWLSEASLSITAAHHRSWQEIKIVLDVQGATKPLNPVEISTLHDPGWPFSSHLKKKEKMKIAKKVFVEGAKVKMQQVLLLCFVSEDVSVVRRQNL